MSSPGLYNLYPSLPHTARPRRILTEVEKPRNSEEAHLPPVPPSSKLNTLLESLANSFREGR